MIKKLGLKVDNLLFLIILPSRTDSMLQILYRACTLLYNPYIKILSMSNIYRTINNFIDRSFKNKSQNNSSHVHKLINYFYLFSRAFRVVWCVTVKI